MTILVSLLVLALVQNAAQNTTAPPKPATLGGRVTDRESGAPLAGAVVRITRVEDSPQPFSTTTDEHGRWQLHDLPAGEYRGSVHLGQFFETRVVEMLRTPDDRSGRILLHPGETRTDLSTTLPRSLAMTVRVLDHWAEPLSRMRVSVVGPNGNRVSFGVRTTDDRGLLRIYGLQRGTYVVCAEPFGPGGSLAMPAGREQLVRTCYPSAADERNAEAVALDADLDNLVITMRRGRTARIAGTVVDASGAPLSGARLSLDKYERDGSSGRSVSVAPDGRFTCEAVVPGEYVLRVEMGGSVYASDGRPPEAAFVPVHVNGEDIENVVVATSRTTDVPGRLVLEDTGREFKRDPGYGPVLIWAKLATDDLPGTGSTRSASVQTDRNFVLERMFGPRTFEAVNIPRGWYVKSIRYGGKEAIDTPIDFTGGEPGTLEILLSTRGSVVAGKAVDDAGAAVRGARVLLFPADPAKWRRYPFTSAATGEGGAFRVGPVRDGEYLVIAVAASFPLPHPDDPEALKRLAAAAERVTLAAEEERTLDLRVINVK